MSAIATLDGKQYNYLRSKLHILVNKVNTRTTISGFKVCLPSPSLTRNTSYPKNLRVIWIGSFSSFLLPGFFLLTVIICVVLMSQEVTNLIYSYFEKGCRKKVHATIPKGNMGYDQCTVPDHCSRRTYFCCFPLALASICPWPLVPFCQISLKNRGLKTTHNTFPDCRVHFFRQPFSK